MSQSLAHDLDEKPRTKDVIMEENFSFSSLVLSPPILQGLKDSGFYKPSPIQLKAIPLGKCGLDLIVQSKSGTGKTVVFTVIALEMIQTKRNTPQILVFAPTREIAVQIEDVIKTVGKNIPDLGVASFIGGLPVEDDIQKIKKCHIAIGAPGRLKHLVEKGYLKTQSIGLLIFDEADKLMEQAFQNDINYIYSKLPKRKQVLTLSATYSEELCKFLENYMQSPTHVTPENASPMLLGIKQFVTVVKEYINVNRQIAIKTKELTQLLSKISYTQCLIFFNSQSRAEGISNTLNRDGWNTLYISAAQSQSKRLKVIKSLKNFECRILLSTDLTARGIDAANVDLIINYDVPFETATYLHRMGRAGRYGSHGLCVTIAGHDTEVKKLQGFLGEIGGTELSIAKLPDDVHISDKLGECDYNSFEKLYGLINDANLNSSSSEDLKKSIFHMKANRKEGVDTEVVSSNLQKLTVDENLDQECSEEQKNVETTESGENITGDICQNVSNNECLKINNDEQTSNMQEVGNEINDKLADLDAETLFKRLASGEGISLVTDEKSNKQSEVEEKPAVSDKINNTFADVDAESLFKSLAAGEDVSLIIGEKSNQQCEESVEKPEINQENIESELVKENDSSVTEEDKMEGMNDWYPWVPVEGYSVFETKENQVNLLEDFVKECTKPKQTKRKINQKSPILEAKKAQKADDDIKETPKPFNKIEKQTNNEVPLRNIALLSVCKLVEEDTSENELKKHVSSITEYLNYMKDKRRDEIANISQQLEDVNCDDLLKNVNLYSQQCRDASEVIDPIEDIFRLGYNSMVKNEGSWIDALGDKYDLEEEISEVENEEEMEYDFEEEYDEEEEEAYEDEDEGEYQHQEDINNQYSNEETSAQVHENVAHHQNFYAMNLAHSHTGSFDDVNGDIYDWHFGYHGQKFLEKANRFEDVSSCNRYLNEWQWQIFHCRDFVKQHIYLQEMNYYLMQKGKTLYNNSADADGASTSMQNNTQYNPQGYEHNFHNPTAYKSYYTQHNSQRHGDYRKTHIKSYMHSNSQKGVNLHSEKTLVKRFGMS
ncbi:hypothetical protein ILUMI_08583 [Ignelater luminosus]|uniref:RNA helicase n=1 Tax=Ignelater luminosus TaxID=2038154 RepID=A0A8K0GD97_IGNLU|nr:hypothetical protein ILUMI_08583 [Ignelater luminosus]